MSAGRVRKAADDGRLRCGRRPDGSREFDEAAVRVFAVTPGQDGSDGWAVPPLPATEEPLRRFVERARACQVGPEAVLGDDVPVVARVAPAKAQAQHTQQRQMAAWARTRCMESIASLARYRMRNARGSPDPVERVGFYVGNLLSQLDDRAGRQTSLDRSPVRRDMFTVAGQPPPPTAPPGER